MLVMASSPFFLHRFVTLTYTNDYYVTTWQSRHKTKLLAGPGWYARIVVIINSSHHHFPPPKIGAAMAISAAHMAPSLGHKQSMLYM